MLPNSILFEISGTLSNPKANWDQKLECLKKLRVFVLGLVIMA